MKYFLIFIYFATVIPNQNRFTEWVATGENRTYMLRVYNTKIEVLIKTDKNENSYTYKIIDKRKKIFEMEGVKYYLKIINKKLFINYVDKKTRVSVDEIITLAFKET